MFLPSAWLTRSHGCVPLCPAQIDQINAMVPGGTLACSDAGCCFQNPHDGNRWGWQDEFGGSENLHKYLWFPGGCSSEALAWLSDATGDTYTCQGEWNSISVTDCGLSDNFGGVGYTAKLQRLNQVLEFGKLNWPDRPLADASSPRPPLHTQP